MWRLNLIFVIELSTACIRGYYGFHCDNECSKNCLITQRCDSENGECQGGCKAGWIEPACEESKR